MSYPILTALAWWAASVAHGASPSVGQCLPDLGSQLNPQTTPQVLLQSMLERGDSTHALPYAEAVVHHVQAPVQKAAILALTGFLQRKAGEAAPASRTFAQLAAASSPFAAAGSYYKAEQALAAGDAQSALQTCEALISQSPESDFRERCQELMPFAAAALGLTDRARVLAKAWDDAHPNEPVGEAVALKSALQSARHRPEDAIAPLQTLSLAFTSPYTEVLARETLAGLHAKGMTQAVVPDTREDRKTRAQSLLESGRLDEAWQAFQALQAEAADSPDLQTWVQAQTPAFAGGTRHFDALVTYLEAQIKDADVTQKPVLTAALVRALERGGHYNRALSIALQALADYPRDKRWRKAHEGVARTALMARAFDTAHDLFVKAAEVNPRYAGRATFFAAFSLWMGGHAQQAAEAFTPIIETLPALATPSRYWRAKALEASDPAGAKADRDAILADDPNSWYGLLLRTPHAPAPLEIFAQKTPAISPWLLTPPSLLFQALQTAPALRSPDLPGFATLTLVRTPEDPQALSALHAFLCTLPPDFQSLVAADALADVGLFTQSGPLTTQSLLKLAALDRRRDPVARELASRLREQPALRDTLIRHTRANYDIARTYDSLLGRRPQVNELWQTAYPLAQPEAVWAASQAHGIDPMLILAIMRTESLYHDNAVSYAGARGPMQIMPRTGGLLSHLLGDPRYTVNQLHEPDTAIDLGAQYLSLLMARFDGVFPLAVASYNGGPHNVSNWIRALGTDTPMDVFVEMMPFGQTRLYVKKVSQTFGIYADIYNTGQPVAIPTAILGDHASLVDF